MPEQLAGDHALELGASRRTQAIALASEVGDNARDFITASQDEDRHMDGIEELQDQIRQMTLPSSSPRRSRVGRGARLTGNPRRTGAIRRGRGGHAGFPFLFGLFRRSR